jgi:ParB family chromosome partitioning protein
MSAPVFEKEKESINRFGMIDPVLVRPLPGGEDSYQIIDGEHRWRACKDLGHEEIPVVIIDVDEPTAKRLTITMNELRGDADPILLSEMLANLKKELDVEDLLSTMPYTADQLENIIDVASIDLDELANRDITLPGEGEEDDWVTLASLMGRKAVPKDAAVVIEAEVDRIAAYYGLTRGNRWQALEIMAVHSSQEPLTEQDPRVSDGE